jgi:hypothetical protein
LSELSVENEKYAGNDGQNCHDETQSGERQIEEWDDPGQNQPNGKQ